MWEKQRTVSLLIVKAKKARAVEDNRETVHTERCEYCVLCQNQGELYENSLSDMTVNRGIDELATDMKTKVLDKIKL